MKTTLKVTPNTGKPFESEHPDTSPIVIILNEFDLSIVKLTLEFDDGLKLSYTL